MKKSPLVNIDYFVSHALNSSHLEDDIQIIINETEQYADGRCWCGYNFRESAEYDQLAVDKGRAVTPQEWRWEFIRRNELYRRIYAFSKLNSGSHTSYSPERIAEDLFGTIYHSDPNLGVLHMRNAAKEWETGRTTSLFCPDFDGTVLSKTKYRPNRIIYSSDRDEKLKFDHPFVFYAAFDPLRDAKEQIDFIKDYLSERQKNLKIAKTHRQFELWPKYLRILDALDAGWGPTEVAHLVESNPEATKASIKQAKSWVLNCLLIL
ncbi:hypothetical protein BOSEA31B_12552 [Hyphomicrobiales bacterium]|nr:hypothetical protein BOSEA31B_12552 [Hyphomicrobiales bacterium]CAH1698319.1 hypothetical protein BOSEA1005_11372 [Hyphomicrobiales bacterium]CAI0341979.1 hypothetical protein BO1005MUT1_120005 [Hyphomicrobiales bacterium]